MPAKLFDEDTNCENDKLLLQICNIYDKMELFINCLEKKLQSYRLIMGTTALFLLSYFIGQSL